MSTMKAMAAEAKPVLAQFDEVWRKLSAAHDAQDWERFAHLNAERKALMHQLAGISKRHYGLAC